MKYLESTITAILNRSPEELIGALLLAAAVAIVMAGFYALARRKSSPSPTVVGGLALAAGVACMALAAGYIEYAETDRNSGSGTVPAAYAVRPPFGPGWAMPPAQFGNSGAGWSSGFHVVVAADEDGDGRLTVDELARLVLRADTDGDGLVNFRDIDQLIADRFRPGSQRPGFTDAEAKDRGGPGRQQDNSRGPGSSIERGALP